MLIFWAISTVVFQPDILTLGFLFICSSRVSHRRITNDSFYSLKDWLSLSVSGAKGSWTLDLLCAKQMLSQLSYSPITSLFYFERPLANFSKTSFCFNRNEAQYEEKPNHGFHILDFSALNVIYFSTDVCRHLFSFLLKLGEETHAPQSPKVISPVRVEPRISPLPF